MRNFDNVMPDWVAERLADTTGNNHQQITDRENPPPHGDTDAPPATTRDKLPRKQFVGHARAERPPTGQRPVAFDDQRPPAIPPEAVPNILRDFCGAVAESLQVPFALAFINALGVLATAAQKKYRVLVRTGYAEHVNIYAVCPLPPGERKSATVAAAKAPLVEWQTVQRKRMGPEIMRAQSERRTMEKMVEARRNEAAKNKDHNTITALVGEIATLEEELPEVPTPPRLLADDFTSEALSAIMSEHGERIGVIEAEGGLFETIAGRYSNGVANLDLVLKSHSGEPCSVDRRGRDPIMLNGPLLTMVISPQPEVVRGLANKSGFRGRGLLGRFLYLLPESRLGHRKIEPPPIPVKILEAWKSTVTWLLDAPWKTDEHGHHTSHTIALNPGAYGLWKGFAGKVEEELTPGGEFEYMSDWAGKLPGQAIRIAGLFHLVTDPQQSAISQDVMEKALTVAAILADHAKAAFSMIGTNEGQECARAILAWIQREQVESFTARDALEHVKGRFSTMEQVNPGLAILEERAFIYPVATEQRSGPGRRPSPTYTVNPLT